MGGSEIGGLSGPRRLALRDDRHRGGEVAGLDGHRDHRRDHQDGEHGVEGEGEKDAKGETGHGRSGKERAVERTG